MPTTLKTVLNAARAALLNVNPQSTSASLEAQLMLCDVLGVGRAYLLAHIDDVLTDTQSAAFEAMLSRRLQGEPLDYIRGYAAFYDREFRVTPAVLIPRPETELLLERALETARQRSPRVVVDVGTGSGALAVTFKAHYPQADVYAVDISPDALAVARSNAETHKAAVTFLHGDLLEPLAAQGVRAELVLANLPYIASDEVPRLEVSKHEPILALDGGADGLDLVRRMLEQTVRACTPDAVLYLEIGADQGQATLDLARDYGDAVLYQDYAGLDRIVELVLRPDLR